VTTSTQKRLAPDGSACSVAGGKTKLARVTFGSIYNYEKQEVLEEGTYDVVLKAHGVRRWPSSGSAPRARPTSVASYARPAASPPVAATRTSLRSRTSPRTPQPVHPPHHGVRRRQPAQPTNVGGVLLRGRDPRVHAQLLNGMKTMHRDRDRSLGG
jgi:hypothetical protein